jgi:hypothetical protein
MAQEPRVIREGLVSQLDEMFKNARINKVRVVVESRDALSVCHTLEKLGRYDVSIVPMEGSASNPVDSGGYFENDYYIDIGRSSDAGL